MKKQASALAIATLTTGMMFGAGAPAAQAYTEDYDCEAGTH